MVTFITEIIIPVVSLLVSTYLIPWLKEKRVYDYAVTAVKAAEQLGKTLDTDKFTYAKTLIQKKFKLSDDDVKRLIEAAVFEITKNK